MSLTQVQRIMNARSAAIYGTSGDPAKWDGGLMHRLLRHSWQGNIFPISRKEPVHGHKAYPDIGSIGEPVDVVCVAVPIDQVGRVIGECAQSLGPRLLEFDTNPVRVSGGSICMADARAVIP